jgi:ribosomal protein S18 acetylase RimI-like enzyme
MMVAPGARRRGIGRALLHAVHREAMARGLTLLVLDTRTGDAAQALYMQAGYEIAGEIPGYALDPDGQGVHGTTVMYRRM